MSSPSTSSFFLSVTLILIGCCLNVVDLEFITKADPGAGVLVTCAQFVFIASEGFLQHYRPPFGLLPRTVPFSTYVKLTAVFFLMSVMNNQALAFSISMPVHTVFRSSSLAASLFLGIVWYGKKYPRTQILSCLLVTFGIMIITLADATLPKECCGGSSSSQIKIGNETKVGNETNIKGIHIIPMTESTRWLIGIMMLTLALLMSAWMGHEQDRVFTIYGKCWKEMLFYIHLCSLPGFVLTWENIRQHIITWMTAPPVTLITLSNWGPITISLPWLLVGNLMTQYVCVRGVYKLTSISGALTTTLIITFRKFISLIISIVYFHNPFTIYHWFGTLLVFIGLCAYSYPSSQPSSHKVNSDAITRDSTNIIPTPSPTSTPNSKDDTDETSDDTNDDIHDDTSTELTPLTHRYPTRGRSRSNSDLNVPIKRVTRSSSRTRNDDNISSTKIHITPKKLVNGVHI